jgi:beta-xylosidase
MKTNGFQLNTLNVSGSGWVVLESSSDLANWTPIQTNGSAAAQQFLDPAALTQPRQFYRVRQQ